MNIKIMSRIDAKEYQAKKKAICISIFSIGDCPIENDTFKLVVPMYIDDISLETEKLMMKAENLKMRAMSLSDVKLIEKFFLSSYIANNEVEQIIINCDAGISRSSAMAILISKILKLNHRWIYESGKYFPNLHMVKMICDYLEYDKSDMDYIERRNKMKGVVIKKVNLSDLI